MTQTITKPEGQIQAHKPDAATTISTRFLADVERQFAAELGQGPKFSEFEKRLTQHMYLRVDAALKAAEAKRQKGLEFTWHTIDRQKLAIDTVHRVGLGLDALIPNHISPVFYFNNRKEQYDVDLQIGYVGRDFIARRHAVEEPLSIVYEVVFSTDTFKALPASSSRPTAGYEFEIPNPFDRGEIVGGFGYIAYDDPRKNKLVLVTKRDFNRSKAASRSNFWRDNDVEMHHKTVVHRVASKIPLDPEKVNAAAFAAVAQDDLAAPEDRADAEISNQAQQLANREVLTLDDKTVDMEPTDGGMTPEEMAEAEARDLAEAQAELNARKQQTVTQPGF